MTDFQYFVTLGLKHVLDLEGYDHMLFLVILSLPYTFRSWRKLLLLITLFTAGHTISLILSNFEIFKPDATLIECLIPITIFIGALFHVITFKRNLSINTSTILYVITVVFGLIHGFGFANYYKMINKEKAILPLLEFALGVELAQIIVAVGLLILTFICLNLIKIPQKIYILILAIVVLLITLPMLQGSCFV